MSISENGTDPPPDDVRDCQRDLVVGDASLLLLELPTSCGIYGASIQPNVSPREVDVVENSRQKPPNDDCSEISFRVYEVNDLEISLNIPSIMAFDEEGMARYDILTYK